MALASCALLLFLYWRGGRRPVRLLPRRRAWGARQWRATSFSVGVVLVALILSNSVDDWFRQRFWLGTAELIVLVMMVAPLIVLGAPLPRFARLLGWSRGALQTRAASANSKSTAVLAFTLFNGSVLLAYVPPIHTATASAGLIRQLSQLLLIGTAVFFWSQVIAQSPHRCSLNHVERVAYLVLSSVVIRVLGLVLGFASAPFYGVPLVDQQVAAGVLLVPGVFTDLIVLTVCLYLWLGQDDRKTGVGFDTGGRVLPATRHRRDLSAVVSNSER